MKALVSPSEGLFDSFGNPIGYRVVEVADEPFEVADPLYWVPCTSPSVASKLYFGGTFFDYPTVRAESPVPASVSRFQARAALYQAGLLDDVEALMLSPAADPISRLAWMDATEFKRASPTILSLMPTLGLTDSQLDDMFRFAATIDA